jgi:hypothetical protein
MGWKKLKQSRAAKRFCLEAAGLAAAIITLVTNSSSGAATCCGPETKNEKERNQNPGSKIGWRYRVELL